MHNGPPPLTCLRNGFVPAVAQLLRQCFQFGHHPLASRLVSDDEVASLPRPLADVREAQTVEWLQLAFSPRLSVRDGVWPKLDQARFVRMYFQTELRSSRLRIHQESLGVLPVFEAGHTITGVAVDQDIPLGDFVTPGLHPKLEDIKDRMERSGMRWTWTMAEAMRRLKAVYLNCDFDACWKFHVD